jgi:hypothetical protein
MPVALNEIPQTQATTGTGAVAGTIFAISQRQKGDLFLGIQIAFSADPGAYVFELHGSVDGVTFGLLGAQITGTTVTAIRTVNVSGMKFVQLNQVSKANAVTATAQLVQH